MRLNEHPEICILLLCHYNIGDRGYSDCGKSIETIENLGGFFDLRTRVCGEVTER